MTGVGDEHIQITNTDLKRDIATLGTITVEVYRRSKGIYHPPGTTGSSWQWDELAELGTLPEKALKGQALSHCTRYDI